MRALHGIRIPCVKVEDICRERMKIPVFHDDQHGTAVVVSAAITNALLLAEKDISEIRLVCTGAGAAAIAWQGGNNTPP